MMPEIMNVKELAAELKVSVHKVYGMVENRQIPYVKLGRSIRFTRDTIEEWLKYHTRKQSNSLEEALR